MAEFMAHNRDILVRTARALGPLCERFVFIGGSIVELLITDEAGPSMRSTEDVDVIVEAATTAEYHDLYPDLANCGFSPDPQSGVICRFKKGDLLLDVMPSEADILGFTNIWYASALRHPMRIQLEKDLAINVIKPAYFLANKSIAFRSRGKSNYFGSHDFEDMIAVVDGRASIVNDIVDSPGDVRAFLVTECRLLMADRDLAEGVRANLAPDFASQSRHRIIIEKLRALAALAMT